MIEDRFDNIAIAITNNREEIEVDFMEKQKLATLNEAGNS